MISPTTWALLGLAARSLRADVERAAWAVARRWARLGGGWVAVAVEAAGPSERREWN